MEKASVSTKDSQSTKPKKAVIYVRCSSDETKKEGYSPDTQKNTAERAIDADGNKLNQECVYEDLGYSGGTDQRPGLQKLLEDARANKFNIVYVSRIDRFFRSLPLLIETMNELKSLGIEVKSATEPFDTTTPTGRAMFHMAGMFAEWQREIGLEARNEGMIKAMKEGKWLGGTAPYGYKLNRRTQKLEIDKKETSVVKMLFGWLVDDRLSEYKIQKRINSMKVPTKYDRLGKKKKTKSKFWWNRRTIGRILRNEIYTGTFYYRKTKYLGRVKGENNLRPKEDWIKVQDKNLRIIYPKLFKRAQEQLKKNKKLSSRNTKRPYALQHKVVCGFDGYHYQCATRCYRSKKGKSRETKYYFCTGTRSYFTPKTCPASTISESRILPPVWKKLKEILANPDLVLDELGRYLNQKSKKKQIQRKLSALNTALDSSRTKRERYAELYAEGSTSKDFYDKKIQECEKQTEELQNEKEKLSQLLLTEEERQQRINSVKTVHQQLKNSLKDTPYRVKREILQRLVEKVVKTGNRLDIEFNFPFKENFLKLTPATCGDIGRTDCPHNHTKTFSIFVTTQLPPKNEVRKEGLTDA